MKGAITKYNAHRLTVLIISAILFASYAVHLGPARTGTGEESGGAIRTETTRGEGAGRGRGNDPMLSISDPTVEYAILAPSDFVSGLDRLADWHSGNGIRTKVYSLDAATVFPGSDVQERIHNFLIDLNDTSPYLKYLLLVGDHEKIPSRYLYVGADKWDLDYSYLSDYYYSGLGSSWDTNDNGTYGEWGEEDWTPDLMVGRIPIDEASEVDGIVDKIINYRTSPPSGGWINKMLIWTSVMVPPNGGSYQSYKDNALELYQKLKGTVPSRMSKYYLRDYDEIEGGNYTLAEDNFTRFNARQQFNDGAALLTFGGQAYYDDSTPPMDNALAHYNGDGTAYSWAISYNYNDGDSATNAARLPFAFIASCDTLNFSETDDTNLERWSTRPLGGVIGQIGSSGVSWRGESAGGASRGNWWLTDKFWELFFKRDGHPGKAFYEMREIYATELLPPFLEPEPSPIAHGMKCNLFGYNFLGDPALDIWTSSPKYFSPLKRSLWDGNHLLNFTMTSSDGTPVGGARVTLESDGRYSSAVADGEGKVSVPYKLSLGDEVNVTLFANGHFTRTKTELVKESPGDLLATSMTVSDAEPGLGTEIDLTATVKNIGDKAVTGAKGAFYLNEFREDNRISALIDLGNIAVGAEAEADFSWESAFGVDRIVFAADPDGLIEELREDNNQLFREITIYAPDLYFEETTLTSADGYNVSTIKGTTVSIYVHNGGGMDAADIDIGIYRDSVSPGNELSSAPTISTMEAGSQTNVAIEFRPEPGYGKYYIAADPGNTVRENNETNNDVLFYMFGNVPPALNTAGIEETELQGGTAEYTVDLAGRITDADTDAEDLIVKEEHDDIDGAAAFFETRYRLRMEFEEDFAGSVEITIYVSDRHTEVNGTILVTVLPPDEPPVISPVPDMSVEVGDILIFNVSATDEDPANLSYSASPDLFDIDGRGRVRFVPLPEHVGDYKITITVTDALENIARTVLNLSVKERYYSPELKEKAELTGNLGKVITFQTEYVVHPDHGDNLNFTSNKPYATVDDGGEVTFNVSVEDMGGKERKKFSFIITLNDGREDAKRKYEILVIDRDWGERQKNEKGIGDYLLHIAFGALGSIIVIIVVVIIKKRAKKNKFEKAMDQIWNKDRTKEVAEPEADDEYEEDGAPSFMEERKDYLSTVGMTEEEGEEEETKEMTEEEKREEYEKIYGNLYGDAYVTAGDEGEEGGSGEEEEERDGDQEELTFMDGDEFE